MTTFQRIIVRAAAIVLILTVCSNLAAVADDVTVDCPSDSLHHCDNPALILKDKQVVCNEVTCEWELDRLDPKKRPKLCGSIEIKEDAFDRLPDFLEPCYLWESMYGNFQQLDKKGKPALLL